MEKVKKEIKQNKKDASRLELYTLIGEGHNAKKDGRTSELSAVKERIAERRTMGV